MRRPLISALVTTMFASVLGVLLLGIGPLGAAMMMPASATPQDPRIELETDLTLIVSNCETCVITLSSTDGTVPAYSSLPATVVDGSVTITLPSARTRGMSVQVNAPWAMPTSYDTRVAWRYAGTEIGDTVSFKDARDKTRASGCWAGTVNEAVTLTVKVRRVTVNKRPAAIAWAPVTESFIKPMQRVRHGVLTSRDAPICDLDG